MSLDSYVISLSTHKERHSHIRQVFNKLNLTFNFFDAINTSQSSSILKENSLTINSPLLSDGEVACYLSHFCLWKRLVNNQLKYMAIFEDDVYLADDSYTLLNDLSWLPNNFDVIKLETMYERTFIRRYKKLTDGRSLSKMSSSHMGAAGYILSYEGALKLIRETQEKGICAPVDHLIFDWLVSDKEVYLVDPAICIQDKVLNDVEPKFESVLEGDRSTNVELADGIKVKPKGIRKLNRELNRIKNQITLYSSMLSRGYLEKTIEYKG